MGMLLLLFSVHDVLHYKVSFRHTFIPTMSLTNGLLVILTEWSSLIYGNLGWLTLGPARLRKKHTGSAVIARAESLRCQIKKRFLAFQIFFPPFCPHFVLVLSLVHALGLKRTLCPISNQLKRTNHKSFLLVFFYKRLLPFPSS